MTDTELGKWIANSLAKYFDAGREWGKNPAKKELLDAIDREAGKILQALKKPVIIEGKTYRVKLVSDRWESLLSQMSTAGYPKELIKRIDSQIKEL